jgi:hypothetical protein
MLISFCVYTYSQEITQTFRGQVRDALTELPLPGASVVIEGTDPILGASTDIDGWFRIENVPVGRIDVRVSMIGYNPRTYNNLLISSGRELIVDVRLEEQVYQLEDVVVTAMSKDQPVNEMAIVSAKSFNIEQTERYAGSLGDPARMAQNFAGVSSAGDQRNDIIIRGNSPSGLLWRLEGVDVHNPNHFGSMGSTGGPVGMINNNLLTNSDFYTGAFPAEFGNALAGAFDLRLRNGNNEKREYLAQVGFNGFELGAEGPFSKKSKASYLINFRYSTMDLVSKLGMDFGTGAAVPQYKDLSFKLNFPTKTGRISVFGLGGDSYIEMLDSQGDSAQYGFSGTDLRYKAKTGIIGLTHVHFFNNQGRLTTTLAATGLMNEVSIYELGFSPDIEALNENDYEVKYSITSKYSRRINSKNFFNAGIIQDLFDVKYVGKQYSQTDEKYLYYMDSHDYMIFSRAFFEWQHKFSDNLSLNTGLHTGLFLLNNSYTIEPRTALKWQLDEKQIISFGFGLHSQTQQKAVYLMQQLVDTATNEYLKTNTNLGFSRSMHLVAGYDRNLGNQQRIKLEVYYQRLFDIPVTSQNPVYSILNSGGDFSFFVYHNLLNEGGGENMGIELSIEKFLNEGFYYLFTASLFDAKYIAYDGVKRNSQFNNNFVLNALLGYEIRFSQKTALAFDIKAVWAGGTRYVPIDEEMSIINDGVEYDWDNAYKNRYPDYFRVNARITFRLNGQKVNQEWGLDIQNLTNHQNIFTQNWNNETKQISTAYQMGFMPMMTYRIHF